MTLGRSGGQDNALRLRDGGSPPQGGWLGSMYGPRQPYDYLDEEASPGARRMIGHIENRRVLIEILGAPIYLDTYTLPRSAGVVIEPFRWQEAARLWSLWAPHKDLVLDIFTRALPSSEELDAKDAFAREHGLDYYYIPPGHVLDFDALRALLAQRERAA